MHAMLKTNFYLKNSSLRRLILQFTTDAGDYNIYAFLPKLTILAQITLFWDFTVLWRVGMSHAVKGIPLKF